MLQVCLPCLAILALQGAWVPEIVEGHDPIGDVDTSGEENGVVRLPDDVDPVLRRWFTRYTRVVAPNGKPIHILAQDEWREVAIVRARKILEHYLTDVPGSLYGVDKRAVANSMADRRATLVLFRDHSTLERALRGRLGGLPLGFQDLRANECPVEGDKDYLAHETRDAAYEEILHLVHDYGLRPIHPELDEALERANRAAQAARTWEGWRIEEEFNRRNEYFAAAYDNYLDLWVVKPQLYEGERLAPEDTPPGVSHFGLFRADSRERLRDVDPRAVELIEAFLPDHLTYTPDLPPDFEGEFSLRLDPALSYTHKSQHLRHARLTGGLPSGLVGNASDNHLVGNSAGNRLDGGSGDDLLEGKGGDDELIGGAGEDVAVFSGAKEEYALESGQGSLVVRDSVSKRDGTDRLNGVELLRFMDEEVRVELESK